MIIQIITLFPEMFPAALNASMLWKAQEKGLVTFKYINLREFGLGSRRTVDDTPYGGGDGMLLKPEPLVAAIEMAQSQIQSLASATTVMQHSAPRSKAILLTPRGKRFNQAKARDLSTQDNLIFVCARYEGYDERVTDYVDEQISIGDYVLTGGEIPAMVVIDSVVRLLPGVLGGKNSALIESFSDGMTLEFPQYTRPEIFRGRKVPEVLLSGDHARINKWRKQLG
jgi:tRNA (guanine37-N1)-methyltransferase